MNRTWRVLGAVCGGAIALASAPSLAAETSIRMGIVTFVSDDSVEVDGMRGKLGPESTIRSDNRTVSPASIRVGMPAELETDSSGTVLQLDLNGVVE